MKLSQATVKSLRGEILHYVQSEIRSKERVMEKTPQCGVLLVGEKIFKNTDYNVVKAGVMLLCQLIYLFNEFVSDI